MFIMDSLAPTVEVVAFLSTKRSRCEIRKRASDNDSGDPIEVRCGAIRTPLGEALKGVSINRISSCRVVMTVNAVHSPRLLRLSNCRGPLIVKDLGARWIKQIQKTFNILPAKTEFVAYKTIVGRTSCYDVIITYDATLNSKDTSYKEKTRQFCTQ